MRGGPTRGDRRLVRGETADRRFPGYTRAEQRLDLVVHAAGSTLALVAGPVLVAVTPAVVSAGVTLSLILYWIGLAASFLFSALYHLVRSPRRKEILRRFDHAAVFLLVAGTCSPFAVAGIGGTAGFLVVLAVWGLACTGVALSFLFPRRVDHVTLVVCLGMGWGVVAAFEALGGAFPPTAFALLLAGGAAYSAGTAFHLARRLPFQNAIWHLCVLAGAICHFLAILGVIGTPVR